MTYTGYNLGGQTQPVGAERKFGPKVIQIGECAMNVFRRSMNRESQNQKLCAIFAGSFQHVLERTGTACVQNIVLKLQQVRYGGSEFR